MMRMLEIIKSTGRRPGRRARLFRWISGVIAFGTGCLWGLSAAATDAADAPPPADAAASVPAAVVPAKSADPNTPFVVESQTRASQLKVMVNKSVVMETRAPYKRVSIGQPEIADVNLLGQNHILVTGKKAGTTQVVVWDDGEKAQVMDVAVQLDVNGLQEQIKKFFPNVKVDVAASNGEVVLRGTVPSLEVEEQIARVAASYAARVNDFMVISGGQQVMLQVRFAEVSRSATTALGVNLGFTDGKSFFASNIGAINPFGTQSSGGSSILASPSPGAAVTLFGQGVAGKAAFQYFIEALRQNNLLRILAEPNITAVSGQEASFLAGGAIPIPVSQGGTGQGAAISVDYREYGVKLKFVPVVLGNGKLRLKVSPEISDLDYANSVTSGGFSIPGITQRKVTTTVELADGQTFAIAGLLNTSVAANKDVTPLLGDLPVIGPMFRTVRYSRKETEMVVLVTPHLVEPLNPADVQRLPGEDWQFPDELSLFLNADLGGERDPHRAPPPPAKDRRAPRYHGQFGFVPAAAPAPAPAPAAVADESEADSKD